MLVIFFVCKFVNIKNNIVYNYIIFYINIIKYIDIKMNFLKGIKLFIEC